ncbi:MAG: hypothetical protein ABIH11_08545 [Candidatus Altiarchaeota archaeon]
MSRLDEAGVGGETPNNAGARNIAFFITAVIVFLAGIAVAATMTAYVFYERATTTTSTSTTSTTSTTTTTTTSTTSTTSTTTTNSTTTSTTSTTTTTVCGGYFQEACRQNSTCSPGFVVNSQNICVPVECGDTVASGNPGCGSWNLNLAPNWCLPGGHNPAELYKGW